MGLIEGTTYKSRRTGEQATLQSIGRTNVCFDVGGKKWICSHEKFGEWFEPCLDGQ